MTAGDIAEGNFYYPPPPKNNVVITGNRDR